jgi:adenosylhomocysteine nucleosidase
MNSPVCKVAIVAALEREVSGLTSGWSRVEREHEGRTFIFSERDEVVVVCGGIGMEAARRAAEAVIALYHPTLVRSVGFAGALDKSLRIGDIFAPAVVIDARDASRVEIDSRNRPEKREGTLVSFMAVAGIDQKANLAQAYSAHAIDMEASAVAAAASAHGIQFDAAKVISDVASFEMPEMARFIDPQGQFRTSSFSFFIALRPWLWPRAALLANNSRKAARALGEHLERLRQELNQTTGREVGQEAGKITDPPSATRPEAPGAVTAGSRTGGHK